MPSSSTAFSARVTIFGFFFLGGEGDNGFFGRGVLLFLGFGVFVLSGVVSFKGDS